MGGILCVGVCRGGGVYSPCVCRCMWEGFYVFVCVYMRGGFVSMCVYAYVGGFFVCRYMFKVCMCERGGVCGRGFVCVYRCMWDGFSLSVYA